MHKCRLANTLLCILYTFKANKYQAEKLIIWIENKIFILVFLLVLVHVRICFLYPLTHTHSRGLCAHYLIFISFKLNAHRFYVYAIAKNERKNDDEQQKRDCCWFLIYVELIKRSATPARVNWATKKWEKRSHDGRDLCAQISTLSVRECVCDVGCLFVSEWVCMSICSTFS